METLALIDSLTNYDGPLPDEKKLDPNAPLKEYSGKTPNDLKRMMRTMLSARRVEREEKLLLRKGYNRFFIGCGGKELADVALAEFSDPFDPFSGYYRNKTFDLARGVTLWDKMLEAIGDPRAINKGMQIPAHPGIPELAIIPQASPTGAHAMEAAGVAIAMQHPDTVSELSQFPGGAFPEDGVSLLAIGEGSTSEVEFARAVFYTVFKKCRAIFAIYNCGWAISVNVHEQYPDGDPTVQLAGLTKHGLKIMHVDGTDVKDTLAAYKEAYAYTKEGNGPVLMNIKTTREGSHSGSDDQSFYMDPDELDWHVYNDCIYKTANTLIEDGILTPKDIETMWSELDTEISELSAVAVEGFKPKTKDWILSIVNAYSWDVTKMTWEKYLDIAKRDGFDRAKNYREYHEKKYFTSPEVPEKTGPMTMRHAINYTLFDLFQLSTDCLLFGEDVADFSGHMVEEKEKQAKLKGKGGVFLVSKHLQMEFGNHRCFNTPLDEVGILAIASGHVYQGRRPMPEIQFLDYISPAYQLLKDRICTTFQRSGGVVRMPMVIRCTYGGYKQGAGAFWHSEANLGTFSQIPGLQIVVPSNAYDAAGMLRTAWASDDPVLFCESVALYNRRDWEGITIEREIPPFEELIPFGKAEVYNADATDIAVITFGPTVWMAHKSAEALAAQGINVRIVDLRSIRPMDEEAIHTAVKECGKVVIVTEDRFWGGIGPSIASLITEGESLFHLEAPVKIVHAINSRVAYGMDGDAACLPTAEKITDAIQEVLSYA